MEEPGMSYSSQPTRPAGSPLDATTPTTLSGIITVLLIPALVIVGLFVMIAIGKLDANVGVPIIATIGGVHGGAVVANSSGAK